MDLCNPEKKYFSQSERSHIEKFLENEPKNNTIYTNKSGERRQVHRVYLPKGCITRETQYYHPIEDGSELRFYHTPRASRQERDALVYYENPDTKERVEITSSEWMKWCVGCTTEKAPEEPPTVVPMSVIKARKEMEDLAKESQGTTSGEKPKEESDPYHPINRRK